MGKRERGFVSNTVCALRLGDKIDITRASCETEEGVEEEEAWGRTDADTGFGAVDAVDDDTGWSSPLSSQLFFVLRRRWFEERFAEDVRWEVDEAEDEVLRCGRWCMRCEVMRFCQERQHLCLPMSGFSKPVRLRKSCGQVLKAWSPKQFKH